MRLVLLNKDNFSEAITLFDNKFYFLTTYPQIVSEEELKKFLLKNGETYIVKDENELQGLAYFTIYEPGYIFIKFKLVNYVNEEACKQIFSKFLMILRNKENNLTRLESLFYEFEEVEMDFFRKCGFQLELIKKDEFLLDNKLGDMFVYSVVDEEISKVFNMLK